MKQFFFSFILLLAAVSASAEEDGLSLCAEGKYFSVYGYQGMDTDSLLKEIDYAYFSQIDSVLAGEDPGKSSLAKAIDGLYMEVSDILDIHVYSFNGRIKMVPDRRQISRVFKSYFQRDFPERSFYLPEKNTIYISFSDLTVGMLGHEIAHAIISRYFVVPPPAKVQEVLCGYVEYKLLKKAGN